MKLLKQISTLAAGAAIIASAVSGAAQAQILQQEQDPWQRERQVQERQQPPGPSQEGPPQQGPWQQPVQGRQEAPQGPQERLQEAPQQSEQQWQEESDWQEEGQWRDEGERLEQGEQQEEGVIEDDGEEERIANPVAEFTGLDKITGRVTSFDVLIDETVQFGALQVTPRRCYSRPPTEQPLTTVFVEVDEVTLDENIERIFTGWMLADSPGLHAVEHPIYDVWLTNCKTSSDDVEVGSR